LHFNILKNNCGGEKSSLLPLKFVAIKLSMIVPIMIPFYKKMFVLFLLFTVLSVPAIPEQGTYVWAEPVVSSNIPRSEKRVLPKEQARDKKVLLLTGNDSLAREIIDRHSLVVGSKITMICRREVYAWLVNHLKVSASLTRILGRNYEVSSGSLYEYHGVERKDLTVDFYRAYQDSTSTIYIGKGIIKIFHISVSGSFINYLEYYNKDDTHIITQNCMYIMLNNSVKRFLVNIIFAVSDIETGILKKIFSLDDTVFKLLQVFMEDPYLYRMLKKPEEDVPEGASELAVKIRDTVVRESSLKESRELGQLIEKARLEVGY